MFPETFPIASNLSISCFVSENARNAAQNSWWLDEGTIILKTFNSKRIRQVIRYRPFHDDGYPRMCLLDRAKAFLTALVEFGGHESPESLSPEQMVGKIFLHSTTPFRPVQCDWSPTPACSQDAQPIAEAIEVQSHYHFKIIPFAEIVRVYLGYNTDATDWILKQHSVLCETITQHLRHHPEQISLYTEVEKVQFNFHSAIFWIPLIEILSRSYKPKARLPTEL
ncbi:uncharacterized protein N7496_006081 [Penicillium cataractarum]|uniref:Uncharacterized protein n=1 Tax=Penicillium cataractarum TaxID=2100454 RepID=A0A9W9S2S5_9EURO|nr:uncharacterized protein N7496_006081 [Penicillium cataractarum]KAJ5369989.1 hypothetical protein N7496_006081 [Penicillium cataractarum]